MCSQNLRMSLRMIQAKVKAFSAKDDFWVSQGWLYRFLNRKKLSLQRKTTMCQSAPADCIPKLVSFVTHKTSLAEGKNVTFEIDRGTYRYTTVGFTHYNLGGVYRAP